MLSLAPLAPHSSPFAYADGSDKHSKIRRERIASMKYSQERGVKMKNKNAKRKIVRVESGRSRPLNR
jgi:hypothetical protein